MGSGHSWREDSESQTMVTGKREGMIEREKWRQRDTEKRESDRTKYVSKREDLFSYKPLAFFVPVRVGFVGDEAVQETRGISCP